MQRAVRQGQRPPAEHDRRRIQNRIQHVITSSHSLQPQPLLKPQHCRWAISASPLVFTAPIMNCTSSNNGAVTCKGWMSDLQGQILLNTEVGVFPHEFKCRRVTACLAGHRHQPGHHASRLPPQLQRHHAVDASSLRLLRCLCHIQPVARSSAAATTLVRSAGMAAGRSGGRERPLDA